MINLRVQAGNGGEDASDFAASLSDMITKSTGVAPVREGNEFIFSRL